MYKWLPYQTQIQSVHKAPPVTASTLGVRLASLHKIGGPVAFFQRGIQSENQYLSVACDGTVCSALASRSLKEIPGVSAQFSVACVGASLVLLKQGSANIASSVTG